MDNINKQTQVNQILYEISLSIGTSLDLRPMLKTSVSTILKKLNCVSGGVYQTTQTSSEAVTFTPQFSIPRTPERNETYRTALAQLPETMSPAEFEDFLTSLPHVGQSEAEHHYHILNLTGFGLLILVKNHNAIDKLMLKSLQPLLDKLAASANACNTENALRQSEQSLHKVLQWQKELHDITLELAAIDELDEFYKQGY